MLSKNLRTEREIKCGKIGWKKKWKFFQILFSKKNKNQLYLNL